MNQAPERLYIGTSPQAFALGQVLRSPFPDLQLGARPDADAFARICSWEEQPLVYLSTRPPGSKLRGLCRAQNIDLRSEHLARYTGGHPDPNLEGIWLVYDARSSVAMLPDLLDHIRRNFGSALSQTGRGRYFQPLNLRVNQT
jgi:hypothetical protein